MALALVDLDHGLVARFERDVLPQVDLLYRAACVLADTPADAEDLVVETVVKALAAYGSFGSAGIGLRAWLGRIFTETANGYLADLYRRGSPNSAPSQSD